ncbi:MAG TPA: TRAP transporter permease [Trueperaceae bacterium]|nr:TRAP transporter permease [Trueperaceae bacterium]
MTARPANAAEAAVEERRGVPMVGWVIAVVTLLALGLGAFQLYTAGVRPFNLFIQRGFHLMVVLLIAFLAFPFRKKKRVALDWVVDGVLMAAAAYIGLYLLVDLDGIIRRSGFLIQRDIITGVIAVLVVLEAARRTIGWAITIVAMVALLYSMAGPRGALPWLGELMPGILAHRGYSFDRIIGHLYLGQEGILGLPLGVAATVVFTFILFGAFLESTGAGKTFIDLAYAVAGRQRGGPAKAAVVASGFMGSVSGSAIANVVTTGAFSIPLMKQLGYKPEEAGGVEAAASTGGQILPPVMGAGAFLMAEYTGVPYAEIVRISILPAIMYFATVYLFVDLIALKRGMRGIPRSELPRVRDVMREGWYYLIPLAVLIYFLMINVSPNRVGFIAIVSILAVSALRWAIRRFLLKPAPLRTQTGEILEQDGAGQSVSQDAVLGFKGFIEAFRVGALNAVPVSIACAVAGVVVGIITLTGLGLKFSALMLAFSGGNLIIAIVLLILASLVLGMGLPVTAAYIVLAVLAAPLLQNEFGIPLLIAHLVIFWYSQDSNVTPPVALAAFAGAGIARADPMKTGFQAWKMAKGLYLIPLFMIYNPELIYGGETWYYVWTILVAFVALGAFAAALEGYMFTRMAWYSRILAGVGLVLIFYPSFTYELIGMAIMLLVLGINLARRRIQLRAERSGAIPT